MFFKPSIINFHFIDFCNYKCTYCFEKKLSRIVSFNNITSIIDNIKNYFDSINERGRINLVGGEIFLCDYLQDIIDYIYEKDVEISLVTNGSLITKDFIISNKHKISTIGISIDSLNDDINKKIGRCNKNSTLDINNIIDICSCIKENEIKLKINHCVSKYNINDDISYFIEIIKPDRFKIFQMTVVKGINDDSINMQVSNFAFNNYCKKYIKYNPIIETEQEMASSYIIVDSEGDLYINKEQDKLGNLITYNMITLMNNAEIDIYSYRKRYQLKN